MNARLVALEKVKVANDASIRLEIFRVRNLQAQADVQNN